jgi:hypothetical protein
MCSPIRIRRWIGTFRASQFGAKLALDRKGQISPNNFPELSIKTAALLGPRDIGFVVTQAGYKTWNGRD